MAHTSLVSELGSIRNPEVAARRRRILIVAAGRLLLLGALVLAWYLVTPKLDPVAFAGPNDTASTLAQWATDGTLLSNVITTAKEIALGYALGASAGAFVAALVASSSTVARIVDPFFIAMYSVPKMAFGPLFILWFGIGLLPKVILSASLVFFIVFYTAYHGIKGIDTDLKSGMKLLGASPTQVRRHVVWPCALQTILLGLKLAVPQAIAGAVIGEFLSSNSGVGYLITNSAAVLDPAGVFAGLVVLIIMAVLLNGLMTGLERSVSPGGMYTRSKRVRPSSSDNVEISRRDDGS